MIRRIALPTLLLATLPVYATNGYLSHGYGVQAKAMAGAGIAYAQDSLAIATNPAGLAQVEDGLELGVDLFAPSRGSVIQQGGTQVAYAGNGKRLFAIPELGYSRALGERLTAGVALYGNGGMNTSYPDNPYARFGATGGLHMDFSQAFLAPAIALKLGQSQSIGAAVNLAYQRFQTRGLGLFAGFSADPASVSDRGADASTGLGVRLGWSGQFGEHLTLGATWQSKTWMGRFDKYAGLFAGQGRFDVPENYGVGLALKPDDRLTVALDWQKILYSGVGAVGNSSTLLFAGVPLGSDKGPGFGWKDVSVVKLGASYAASDALTLRAGVSRNSQPIPSGETFINIIAPGVVRTHLTAGFSLRLDDANSINASYLHALRETVRGHQSIPPAFGGGEVANYLAENSLGISWSHRF